MKGFIHYGDSGITARVPEQRMTYKKNKLSSGYRYFFFQLKHSGEIRDEGI